MSIFTYHLIEALTGRSDRLASPEVRVTEVMNYLDETVPKTARAEKNKAQTPHHKFEGTGFPIALIMGGKGAARNEVPDPLEHLLPKVVGKVDVDTVEKDGEAIAINVNEVHEGEAHGIVKAREVKGKVVGASIKKLGR